MTLGLAPSALADVTDKDSIPPLPDAVSTRFTEVSLATVLAQLTDVGSKLQEGQFLGFHYNLELDAVEASGNIDSDKLPADLLASGHIVFTCTDDGGRDVGVNEPPTGIPWWSSHRFVTDPI
jgi:hypothetical protein